MEIFGIEITVQLVSLFFLSLTLLSWIVARYFYLNTDVNETILDKDKVVFKLALPRHNDKGPLAAEQLYSALHGMIQGKTKSPHLFSIEIVAGSYGIHFFVVTNKRYQRFFENQYMRSTRMHRFKKFPTMYLLFLKILSNIGL